MTTDNTLQSGALDFGGYPLTGQTLRSVIQGMGYLPVKPAARRGKRFPMFMALSFSLMEDYGFLINVWVIRNETERFRVIGGVKSPVAADQSQGYVSVYQKALNEVLASDIASANALAILDHIVTNYLEGTT